MAMEQVTERCGMLLAMEAEEEKGQYALWKKKEVLASRQLLALDTLEGLTHEGMGTMDISRKYLYRNCPTLHLGGSHNDKNGGFKGGSWSTGANIVHMDMKKEDFSAYTRVSMWCYADVATRPNTWLYFVLCNGEDQAEGIGGLDSRTGFNVPSRQWYQLIWEFHSHQRDAVREFVLVHDPQGTLPEDDDRYDIYFSDLCVEQVEPDYVDGWELGDRIAYCQIGYLPDAPKKAVMQNAKECRFTVKNAKSGRIAFTGEAETVQTDLGTYQVLDFSSLQSSGEYILYADGRSTHPFPIGNHVLASPIWKNLNFFYQERCGCEVPGLHGPCGRTDFIKHPDGIRSLNAAGGWHDAGDLCQELCTTADAITVMLDLAEHLEEKDSALKDRVLAEAKYGLDWILKTRFGDGYYAFGSGHMRWDGNVVSEEEEDPFGGFLRKAVNESFGNWFRAGVEAQGAIAFREGNGRYARLCEKAAQEDFAFALEMEGEAEYELRRGNTATHELQTLSHKGFAAIMLYRATGKEEYLEIAAQTARLVLNCQQQELPDWDIPLGGFFWCEQEHVHIAAYEHQSAEQEPIVFLVRLLEEAPAHPDAELWEQGCRYYAEYIKNTADMVQPFGLLPSAIYSIHMEPPVNTMRFEGEAHVRKLYHDSIVSGIRLSEEYYMRRMPVSSELLRGFFAPVFAKATAVGELSRLFHDKQLRDIALEQVAWMLGKNPFARSDMYGEGYGFQPLYTPYSPDMVGAIPVGIQSKGAKDAPYLPADNRPTFNEVWIHSSSRFLWTMANLVDWL